MTADSEGDVLTWQLKVSRLRSTRCECAGEQLANRRTSRPLMSALNCPEQPRDQTYGVIRWKRRQSRPLPLSDLMLSDIASGISELARHAPS